MSHEIYYTSAPEGLKRGSSGFSTVGATEGMPKALWDRLETLSAYRHHFGIAGAGGDPGLNPISWAHYLLNVAGTSYHVLSRVCDSGVDHTQRTNAFAHHLVVDAAERNAAQGGPAWLLMHQGVMTNTWDNRVGKIARLNGLPQGDVLPGTCKSWAAATGDAGWGGVLADVFAKSPTRPVCILFAPGQQMLPLMAETIALLPHPLRWNVTFNTYFTSIPTSATCAWRCCLTGSPAAQLGLRYAGSSAGGIVLDLTEPERLGAIPDGPYVEFARTGQMPPSLRGAIAAGASKSSPKPSTSPAPTTASGTPAPPATVIATPDLDDDEDSIDLSPPDMTGVDIDSELGKEGLKAAAPGAAQPSFRRPPLLRTTKSTIPRAAELTMDDMRGEAARAAAKRRKQVILLFFCAIGAIAVGTILVIFINMAGGPPEVPVTPAPKAQDATAPSIVNVPKPTTPASPAPYTNTPAPVPGSQAAVIVPEVVHPPTKPAPVTTPTQFIPRFPAVITMTRGLDAPAMGAGLNPELLQELPLPKGELDPALDLKAINIRLPMSKADDRATLDFSDKPSGSLVASTERRDGKPVAVLSWKETTSEPSEIAAIGLNKQKTGLNVSWKTRQLMKTPESVTRAYWALRSSTLALQSNSKSQAQEIAMSPFEAPMVSLEASDASIPWPAEVPVEATPSAVLKSLPEGWESKTYSEWNTKSGALRTSESQPQIVHLTNKAATQAWFIVKFSPQFDKLECTFKARLDDAQAKLADAESDVKSADEQLERYRQNAGGTLPTNNESVNLVQQKRKDALANIQAFKAVIAAYKQFTDMDIDVTLPNGVRLTTVHFHRASQ